MSLFHTDCLANLNIQQARDLIKIAEANSVVTGPNDCKVLKTPPSAEYGYGVLKHPVTYENLYIHSIAYLAHYGQNPVAHERAVAHICGNRACFKIEHLVEGEFSEPWTRKNCKGNEYCFIHEDEWVPCCSHIPECLVRTYTKVCTREKPIQVVNQGPSQAALGKRKAEASHLPCAKRLTTREVEIKEEPLQATRNETTSSKQRLSSFGGNNQLTPEQGSPSRQGPTSQNVPGEGIKDEPAEVAVPKLMSISNQEVPLQPLVACATPLAEPLAESPMQPESPPDTVDTPLEELRDVNRKECQRLLGKIDELLLMCNYRNLKYNKAGNPVSGGDTSAQTTESSQTSSSLPRSNVGKSGCGNHSASSSQQLSSQSSTTPDLTMVESTSGPSSQDIKSQDINPTIAADVPGELPADIAPELAPGPAPDILPTDVPLTNVPPTNVPPTNVPPADVPPADVLPADFPPADVLPADVPPTNIPPTNIPDPNWQLTKRAQEGSLKYGLPVKLDIRDRNFIKCVYIDKPPPTGADNDYVPYRIGSPSCGGTETTREIITIGTESEEEEDDEEEDREEEVYESPPKKANKPRRLPPRYRTESVYKSPSPCDDDHSDFDIFDMPVSDTEQETPPPSRPSKRKKKQTKKRPKKKNRDGTSAMGKSGSSRNKSLQAQTSSNQFTQNNISLQNNSNALRLVPLSSSSVTSPVKNKATSSMSKSSHSSTHSASPRGSTANESPQRLSNTSVLPSRSAENLSPSGAFVNRPAKVYSPQTDLRREALTRSKDCSMKATPTKATPTIDVVQRPGAKEIPNEGNKNLGHYPPRPNPQQTAYTSLEKGTKINKSREPRKVTPLSKDQLDAHTRRILQKKNVAKDPPRQPVSTKHIQAATPKRIEKPDSATQNTNEIRKKAQNTPVGSDSTKKKVSASYTTPESSKRIAPSAPRQIERSMTPRTEVLKEYLQSRNKKGKRNTPMRSFKELTEARTAPAPQSRWARPAEDATLREKNVLHKFREHLALPRNSNGNAALGTNTAYRSSNTSPTIHENISPGQLREATPRRFFGLDSRRHNGWNAINRTNTSPQVSDQTRPHARVPSNGLFTQNTSVPAPAPTPARVLVNPHIQNLNAIPGNKKIDLNPWYYY